MAGFLKIVLCIICLTGEALTVTIAETKDEVETVIGAHLQILRYPHFYHTLIPVLFEIPLPKWKLSDLFTKWPRGYGSACNQSDHFADNWATMSCPVDYYLRSAIEQAYEKILPWKNFVQNENRLFYSHEFRCGEISPHFQSFGMSEDAHIRYIEDGIKLCPPGTYVHINLTKPATQVQKSLYDLMLARFIDEFDTASKFRIGGYVKYAATINAHTSIQLAQLVDFHATNKMFTDALAVCSTYKLPPTLISTDDLQTAFKELEKMYSTKTLELTFHDTDPGAYYKQELTDCTVTASGNLLIRLYIPLRKTGELNLHKLVPKPFIKTEFNRTEICEYDLPFYNFIADANMEHLFATDCKSEALCEVPELSSRVVAKGCIHSLFSGHKEDILRYCHLHCDEVHAKDLPYFRQIDTNRYVVAGPAAKNQDIFVYCAEEPVKILRPPVDFGALEVVLPCHCKISYNTETLTPYGLCDDAKLIIKAVLPHHWKIVEEDYVEMLNSSLVEGRAVSVELSNYNDLKYYMNLNFSIISVVIMLLVLSNVVMCFVIVGIVQRLNKFDGLLGGDAISMEILRQASVLNLKNEG